MLRPLPFFALLIGCSKPAEPLELEKLSAPVGQIVPAFCTKGIDGKRFTIDGVFSLPSSVTVNEKGLVDLRFSKGVDAEGRADGPSIQVTAKNGKHLDDLTDFAEGMKQAGYRTEKGVLKADALRVRAAGGEELHALQPASVTIEVEVLTKFQSDEVAACIFNFVEARKRTKP